ncbi:class III lanthionine synthetase LanKC [Streptomyces sp. NPDC005892]|uniref:class III lanthionine synthetase LanKC n=1 Tax=Streptomyces sp. NPDC005892 TaxID=3155593 RepID=UPI0033E81F06
MDILRHLAHCPPGTPFFDRDDADSAAQDDYPAVSAPAPAGWTSHTGPDWAMLTPPDHRLPPQGWKIHVSAVAGNAEDVLDRCREYLVPRGIAFKFIRSRKVLLRRNGKYGDRSASGKFVTVYPRDEESLGRVLEELGTLLDGEPGPYILSDLRWRSGPLYVRYGGFVARTMKTPTGETVHCVEDPDGNLVPDKRLPTFRPPEWVTLPACLEQALRDRNSGTLEDFPYRAEKALHFSNGGGVYRGSDLRTGGPVLLREARPHSGIDTHGNDAVARLEHEHSCLEKLGGLRWFPRLIEARKGHEHHFLVREFVEGETLGAALTRRLPQAPEADPGRTAAYTRWALDVLADIERGVTEMHARGVFFGDLHPGNVLVRPDDTVVFIDLETATTDPDTAQIHAAPGFGAPAGHRGPDIDRYALGCLRVALFAPLTTLMGWGPHKVEQLIAHITTRYPLPEDWGDRIRADLAPLAPLAPAPAVATPQPQPLPQVASGSGAVARAAVAEGILATATPDRADRLFPGDATQFLLPGGGAGLAYGAAGVLWALAGSGRTGSGGAEDGTGVPEAHVDWLERAATDTTDVLPGLWTGLSGIASALLGLGRADAAAGLLARVRVMDPPNDSYFDGLAGIALAQLHLARTTGDEDALKHATAAGEQLSARAAATPPRRGQSGLMRGRSGGARLLLALYEQTSDAAWLDSARDLLTTDVTALGWTEVPGTGSETDTEGWAPNAPGCRPLLAAGGAGTALVLADYLDHRQDPRFTLVADRVRAAAREAMPRTAGLFHGWAGAALTLRRLGEEPSGRLLDVLDLYRVEYAGRPAFLGHENLRLSTDLATGAAGVVLALGPADDGPAALPFW